MPAPSAPQHGLQQVVKLVHLVPSVIPEVLEQTLGPHGHHLTKEHRIIVGSFGLSGKSIVGLVDLVELLSGFGVVGVVLGVVLEG